MVTRRKPCQRCQKQRAKVKEALRKRDLKLAVYYASKGVKMMVTGEKSVPNDG